MSRPTPDTPSPERWARLEALFAEALELAPEERARFARELPEADAALRDELLELLEAHLRLGSTGPTSPGEAFLERLDAVRAAALVEEGGGAGPGGTVGRYRLLERLGEGGMGVVWRAFDPRLEREVALKLLPPWLASDGRARERFLREARAASALDHPNIATVFEIDASEDGRPWIAMACYRGRTLADRLADGPLPPEEIGEVAEGILRGLAAAHEAGVIHRDVKPANVMLPDGGGVKLLDFGVAKMSGAALTRTGVTPGTVAWMSPEQTRGQEVDARSDLWAVGVVLYEMLTGRRPFAAPDPDALVYQIRHDAPPPLEELPPGVPAELAALVECCLRKDPGERPESARRALEVLAGSGAARGGEAPARGPDEDARDGRAAEGAGRSGPPLRRRWVGMAAATALVGILGAALVLDRGRGGADAPRLLAPGAAEPRSLAVLPFESLDPEEAGGAWARGIHDDLVTRLSAVSGLRVTSRRAVEGFRDSGRTTAAIAEELGVRWVVEGSVATADGGLRVNARLVDPRTESQVWARSYRTPLSSRSLVEIPGQIATEVALSLDAEPLAGERARVARGAEADLETYRLYVEGRTNLERRTEAGLRLGAEAFREALDRSSDHAPSWAGLSEALGLLVYYGHEPPDPALVEAQEAADRALALEPELADAHASRGFLLQQVDRDGPAALASYRQALALEPSHARAAHWLGGLLMSLGRLEDARVPLERAVELDPTSPVVRLAMARWYQFVDSPAVALEHARLAARLAPSAPQAQMVVGEILRELGRSGEAQVVLERALGLPGVNSRGVPGLWVELALVYESLGDARRADALLAELDPRASPSAWAAVEATRGNRAEAMTLLAGSPVVPDFSVILRYHHVFDPLRPEPAFQELLARYDAAWGLGGGPAASP